MKKRGLSILLALVLVAILPLLSSGTVFALEGDDMILDHAGLLEPDQRESLNQEAKSYGDAYGCGVYVLTVDSMGGMNRRDFAEQYYIENDLGVGPEDSGILFMVSMMEREYITITRGYGIQAFTDYGIAQIENDVLEYLGDDEWYDAFETFVSDCGYYLEYAAVEGVSIDVNSDPKEERSENLVKWAIVIFVPLLIALILCLTFYAQMKTARRAIHANSYIPRDGFDLTYENDQFLYRTQSRRVIKKSDHDGGFGGGGSTISSRGFGGSKGGKF